MVKGLHHYLKEQWNKPNDELTKERMIAWRAGQAIERVDRPLRLDRARSLGYKAKRGIIVVRVRLKRGGRRRQRFGVKGRKSRKQTIRKTLKMNYRWVAETRAARKYENMNVLNSYWIGKDGKHYYFEVILIDSSKAEIKNDRVLKWISHGTNKKRAERGLTSAAKKSRGLRHRSKDMKVRPSLRSWNRKGK